MSYRIPRLASVVRNVVSDTITNRVSDPRIHRFTSVTRVELSADLKFADVYVSVMGTDAQARTTMKGLESARGMVQSRLARRLTTRQCPLVRFHLDMGIKLGIETIRRLDEEFAHDRDAQMEADDDGSDTAPDPDEPRSDDDGDSGDSDRESAGRREPRSGDCGPADSGDDESNDGEGADFGADT